MLAQVVEEDRAQQRVPSAEPGRQLELAAARLLQSAEKKPEALPLKVASQVPERALLMEPEEAR
jgi:hypothetical protein